MDLLDVDALVWLNLPADQKHVDADPLYDRLPVASDHHAVTTRKGMSEAVGFVSPLSLPYVVERLVPALALAVAGKPTEPVG